MHYPSKRSGQGHHHDAEFDAEADARNLKEAVEGLGTDEQAIIDITSNRSNRQRVLIAKEYKSMYGKEFKEHLGDEYVNEHFRNTILSLFDPSADYDAHCLRKAMKGAGTDEETLIDILCTRNNEEILEIIQAYKRLYDRDLEADVRSETSGYFEHLLVALLQANRTELTDEQWAEAYENGWAAIIDQDEADQDAQNLMEAGEARWGTDESEFNSILAKRNYFQLRAVFEAYQRQSGKDIIDAIENEVSGNLQLGFKAIVLIARHAAEYFATRIHHAIAGAGTDDDLLIRMIVSRSEIDLKHIGVAYQEKYEESLEDAIGGDTSGDYKKILLAIVQRAA